MGLRIQCAAAVVCMGTCGWSAPGDRHEALEDWLRSFTIVWDCPDEWTSGMPIWVVVTVTQGKEGQLPGPYPERTPFSYHGLTWSLGLEGDDRPIAGQAKAPSVMGSEHVSRDARGRMRHTPLESIKLPVGRPVRLAFALPMPGVAPHSGDYVLELQLCDAIGLPMPLLGPKAPHVARIRLKAPSEAAAPLVEEWPSAGFHVADRPLPAGLSSVVEHLSATSGAVFELGLRRLLEGEPLDEQTDKALDTVPAYLQPEVHVLRWWSVALVDPRKAEGVEAELREQYMALRWRLDQIQRWMAAHGEKAKDAPTATAPAESSTQPAVREQ